MSEKIQPILDKNLSKIIDISLGLYLVLAVLGVVFTPYEILDKSEICAKFVNFMKEFFPNIEIFAKVSKYPQLTEFYVSYMWVLGILFCLIFMICIICSVIIDKNRGRPYRISFLLIAGFGILVFAMGAREYYWGLMATRAISFGHSNFWLHFNSKFELCSWILFFQGWFIIGIFMILTGFVVALYYVNNLKRR